MSHLFCNLDGTHKKHQITQKVAHEQTYRKILSFRQWLDYRF